MHQLPDILNKVVNLLRSMPEVERVIIFGSRARGDADPRADIDIAVDAPCLHLSQWLEIEEIIDETDTLLSFDLVRLDEASENLRSRIAEEGIIVYDQSEKLAEPAESQ